MKEAMIQVEGLGAALKRGSWEAVLDAFLAANVDSDNTRQAYRRQIRQAFISMKVPSLAAVTSRSVKSRSAS